MSTIDAIGHAAATSGAAVAFAGITVVIALLSLAVSGITLITVLGQASAIVVGSPCRVDDAAAGAARPLRRQHRAAARRPRQAARRSATARVWSAGGERPRAARASSPWSPSWCCSALSMPVRSLELGLTDQSSAPKSTTSRQAYDLMTENFGAGSNGRCS